MYDLGDFGKSFDADKVGKGLRIPRFPKGASGNFELDIKRLVEKEGDTAGKMFELTFVVDKSSDELVVEGCTYTKAYFQGASKVDREKCWRKLLPMLLAVTGAEPGDAEALANAPETLGTLLASSTDQPATATEPASVGEDLNLKARLSVKQESARKNKDTGKVDAKFLNEDGTPKIFAEDTWSRAAVAVQAAA